MVEKLKTVPAPKEKTPDVEGEMTGDGTSLRGAGFLSNAGNIGKGIVFAGLGFLVVASPLIGIPTAAGVYYWQKHRKQKAETRGVTAEPVTEGDGGTVKPAGFFAMTRRKGLAIAGIGLAVAAIGLATLAIDRHHSSGPNHDYFQPRQAQVWDANAPAYRDLQERGRRMRLTQTPIDSADAKTVEHIQDSVERMKIVYDKEGAETDRFGGDVKKRVRGQKNK